MADVAKIGEAGDVIVPKQPSKEEEEGYSWINEDEDQDNNSVDKLILKDDDDDGDPPVEDYDPTEFERYNEHNELTFRTVFVGCLIGILVAAMNVNFGLRTGWCQGGSVFSSIIAIGIFKIANPTTPFTKWETTLAVTAASAAGTMTSAAGLVSSMPALKMMGHEYAIWQHYLWAFAVAYFGVYFAVPMRRHMIVIEKLRFPSGTATAMTIKAMFAKGEDTVKKAKSLLFFGIASGVWCLFAFFIPLLQDPPMPVLLHKYGFTLHFSPMLLGGGMLSGLRATGSLVAGSIIGWAVIGPIVESQKLVQGAPMSYVNGIRGWILWVGVAVMAADSIVQLLSALFTVVIWIVKMIINRYRNRNVVESNAGPEHDRPSLEQNLEAHMIPWFWPIIGLVLSTVMLTLIGHFVFGIKYYFVWAAIPLGALLSLIAARCCGETDINPVGSMGKVTQLVFAGVAPKQPVTNILSAAIVAAGASQCGDMMQDLKTGYLMRVAPRKIFISQCIGIVAGIIACVPIYKLFVTAYQVGEHDLPAPAAHAWRAVAEVLSHGKDALPPGSPWGMLGGGIIGLLLSITNKTVSIVGEKYSGYVPSALAFGIGMIVPARQSVIMFTGACIYTLWKRGWPQTAGQYFYAVSSGLIAGEGLMGIVVAFLKICTVGPLVKPWQYPAWNATMNSNGTFV
ncbi:hypothetical protein AKO1_009024 [Acrasis kona]|uniref:Oligopeptide transporter n=1 Tax=Acrasis kona TaxID=1008807 RepID=A0AAW2ZID5_9EUKA